MIRRATDSLWYLLATIYGEQSGEAENLMLLARNRRIWNGWFCGNLAPEIKTELARLAGLDTSELAPLTEEEEEMVIDLFTAKKIDPYDLTNSINIGFTVFEDFLSMRGFIFLQKVQFQAASFQKIARFDSAVFCNGVDFSQAHFRNTALFASTIFQQASFFQSTIFEKCAYFSGSLFEKQVKFDDARFHDVAQFNYSRFSDFTYFSKAKFSDKAMFNDCQFSYPISFRDAQFQKHFPALAGAILHTNTTFTANDTSWPTNVEAPPEESRESLAIIRHAVGKQGVPEDEHYFFRREMAFAARIDSPLQRFPYQVFGALSNFGYSLAKPTLWLAGVWFAGFLAYSYWLTWLAPALADAHPIFTAAGFSVAQLFGFLGFTGNYFRAEFLDALPTALKILAGLQTVAGVVLLFFLGLGLRNRFRLK